jgi:hypothetical protein
MYQAYRKFKTYIKNIDYLCAKYIKNYVYLKTTHNP